jgi:hypothetical protein
MANDQLIEQVDRLLTVEHFDAEVRNELTGLGPDALDLLCQYATGSHPSGNPDIQGRAIVALGESGAASMALPALGEALESPDVDTRIRVLRSLGRLGGSDAIDMLREAIERDELMDAEKAHGIRALAMIDSERARDTLTELGSKRLSAPLANELRRARDESTG